MGLLLIGIESRLFIFPTRKSGCGSSGVFQVGLTQVFVKFGFYVFLGFRMKFFVSGVGLFFSLSFYLYSTAICIFCMYFVPFSKCFYIFVLFTYQKNFFARELVMEIADRKWCCMA